jgi:lysophospholipase L1-like esterase
MSPQEPQPIRFLALGDSYTIGEAVPLEESWPYQLVRIAASRGISLDLPVMVAKTGWTTDELLEGIRMAQPEGPFDLVSLLTGVNNLYRERPVDNFRIEFRTLLEKALHFAGERPDHVVVLSIPDWGATPFAEGKDRMSISGITDDFNEVCRNEAKARNVHYIDVTGISRRGLAEGSLLTIDRLHPSGAMYALWAGAVCDALFSINDR